ncbi:MAG TPA: FecR family protein [Puia sp.]|nr:FecR family protein [Puia sp.]
MKRKALYKQLVSRYMEDKASDREKEVFFHLLSKGKLDKYLHEEMEARAEIALSETSTNAPGARAKFIPLKIRYAAAAAILTGLLVAAGLLKQHSSVNHQPPTVSQYKNEVYPGGNHAILTLSDGSKLVLDSTKKGLLSIQGKARLTKAGQGNLVYQAIADEHAAISYNTIATPAGGQYQVTLADGTKVWLNALSTLKFPTSFSGAARTVDLKGEAWFEVAQNKNKAFHVLVGGMDIQVLGTKFNVNAYTDESSLKTTLMEGSVRLVKDNQSLILAPGQQGQTAPAGAGTGTRAGAGTGAFVLIKDANTDEALAWKNGYFSFDDADIHTIMRQLARWYGIQVKYEGTPTKTLFWGKMGRDLNLTQVLAGLDKSKVHFQLEGTTLTVLP